MHKWKRCIIYLCSKKNNKQFSNFFSLRSYYVVIIILIMIIIIMVMIMIMMIQGQVPRPGPNKKMPGVRPGPAHFFGSRPWALALDHHDHDHDHDDDDHDQDDDDYAVTT